MTDNTNKLTLAEQAMKPFADEWSQNWKAYHAVDINDNDTLDEYRGLTTVRVGDLRAIATVYAAIKQP